MKLKKVFAGMAASAIAMSVFAMTSTTSAAALDQPFNAGVCFQTNMWTYRNSIDKESELGDGAARFPGTAVGVNGDGGFDTAVAISDAQIQYDGTYTISIAANGTVNDSPKETTDAETGEVTSTMGNGWGLNAEGEKFNLLSIGTDLKLDGTPSSTDDVPMVNGTEIKFTDVTASWGSNSYTADVYAKGDAQYLTVCLINAYDKDDSPINPDDVTMPAEGETITIQFTVSGLGEDPNAGGDESSEGDTSSEGDASSEATSSASSSSSAASSSSASKASSSAASKDASSSTSDNTANAEAGAPAGIALALAAVAGAAIVVSRKK